MRLPVAVLLLALALSGLGSIAHAAEPDEPRGDDASAQTEAGSDLLRVYLDCPEETCDAEFFRTEISFVDFVRDRADADVHVIVTPVETGSGGTEYTLRLIGRGRFVAVHDRLTWVAAAQAPKDDIRRGLASTLELGLVRYAAHTPAAPHLSISYDAPEASASGRARDPWNAWTFQISTQSTLHGEKSQSEADITYAASANRVTDAWKYSLGANGAYSESHFQLPGPPVVEYTSIARTFRVGGDAIRSFSPHWSARAFATATSSTFTNQAFAASGVAGLEYDVFPYSESTRRLLTLRWHVGEHYWKYGSETVYGYLDQYFPSENVDLIATAIQPWGEASLQLSAANDFLRDGSRVDLSKNRASGSLSLELKLMKGFALTMAVEGALLHDQIFLAKQGATDAEVLLERRQLETSFNYYTSIGLSYTFGSIYSTVVNPRFGTLPSFN